ncbi:MULTISPECIES: hypothetical protein [Halobacteriovorax]|uniref:DUF2383 domain-containing protein n=1 Tax=Halobacteriovorax vibrionivorans TaxID=2152716 RepID=A0ABY0IIF3_9BACT|nr:MULTISPECIES: hypothetical protein [Halobacteriovorax]AYF45306.1 hypothetical protein BALOs_2308 [Halobacteriovorax sp. BALOs_7]RZF22392.1 hypothetical protein DAY19_01070 [Halobacteriovorax vibrionivorans]TGD48644.1 hypothetical protein EP118_03985 [Halobacteriovorax sp. Y22]
MSTAKKLDSEIQEETNNVAEEAAANVLEFSITRQIQDVDLSKLGESPEDSTGSLTNINSGAQPVGEVTHTQILNLAKANNEVDVLEAQVKLIALFVSEARILEAELNKYIHAIHKQSPQSKKYLLQMKKVVKDFSNIEKILDKAKSVK